MPCLSSGRRERRISGGQRGWPGPAEPTVTPRWDGRARQTSPLGSGTPGAVLMGWSGPRRTGAGHVTGPGSWGPGSMGAPRPGVGLARGAGPEVREDLVDHRRLSNERDDAHRAVAGRTRERVDLKELLEQRRRRAFAHRRLAPTEASRRMPRGRLA